MTFPSITSAGIRPPRADSLILTAYDQQLIARVAEVMEPEWHRRSPSSAPDIHTVIGWLKAERTVWESLKLMCASQARHWPERYDLLHAMDLATSGSLAPGSEFHPQLLESRDMELTQPEPNFTRSKSLNDQAKKHADKIDGMMGSLKDSAKVAVEVTRTWIIQLEREDESGRSTLPSGTVQAICSEYAAAWQRVSEWFASGVPDPTREAAKKGLERALKQIRKSGCRKIGCRFPPVAIQTLKCTTGRGAQRALAAGHVHSPPSERTDKPRPRQVTR